MRCDVTTTLRSHHCTKRHLMHVDQHACEVVKTDVVCGTVEDGLDLLPYMCKVLQFARAGGALGVQHCPVDVQMHAEVLDLE